MGLNISFLSFVEVRFVAFVHFKLFYILGNTNYKISNTTVVNNVNKNKIYLKNYNSISEDVKFATNSVVRLKIMATLYNGPQNMKSLNEITGLNYSSISSGMHDMELKDYVYRQNNKYHLANSIKFQIKAIIEFDEMMNVLDDFFNILDHHLVEMLPDESVTELYLLGKASLMESDDVDAFRIYKFIENSLFNANDVKCVLPFYYENFTKKLNGLIRKKKNVEVLVPKNLQTTFKLKSRVKKLSTFKGNHNFLLIVTNKIMILGFFKEDGYFDKNRLLTSKNPDAIRWANDLFVNFKNENK